MCLETTWTALIHAQISGTKRWGRVPPIDLCETRRCIRACGFIDRKLVMTHLTGSLRTTDMKSHWLPNEELLCPLCQGTLDDDHIVCHCSLLQTTRQPWEEFLHELTGDRRYLVHSPFCASLPESWEVRAGLILEQVSLECSQIAGLQEAHIFFTDGSASSAFHGLDAIAAWAICKIPQETASLWVQNDASVPSELHFRWSCSGRVPSLQTNNRAELFAIALVIANTTCAEIVTDSQYALDMAHQILREPAIQFYVTADNFDILQALCTVCAHREPNNFVFHKVKSHVELPPDAGRRDHLHVIGNDHADRAAKHCRDTAGDPISNQIRRFRSKAAAERSLVTSAMKCMAALHLAFVKAVEKLPPQQLPQQSVSPSSEPFAVLKPEYISKQSLPLPIDLHDLSHILFWGSTFTARMLAWARLLQWPLPHESTCGDVSFYELYIFCICTQSVLPVNEGTKYQPRYVLPDQKPESALVPQPAALVLRNWATALVYLANLCNNRCCKETI